MSIWHTDVSITGVRVHVWVHVLNTLVFNEILERRCSLMLLVTHSARQLRSLSAWSCLHTTVHPSRLPNSGRGNGQEETQRRHFRDGHLSPSVH